MKKHSSPRYQQLAAGFSASAFALLITVSAQHVSVNSPTLTAATAPTLESCNAAGQKAEIACEKKFDSCSKKITIKVQKCEQKVDKKQQACNAKAEKARLKCEKKGDAQLCQQPYNDALDDCNYAAEDAALVCKDMEEALIDCEEVSELCKVNVEEAHEKCTSKIKPAA